MRVATPLPLVLLLVLSSIIATAEAHNVTVSPNWHFGLPTYGTYINFASEHVFGDVHRESDYWYFDSYRFRVQSANLTIAKFFQQGELVFTVSGTSGVRSTTTIYCPNEGKPDKVVGATEWTWTEDGYLTIAVDHRSAQTISVFWDAGASGLYMLSVFIMVNGGPASAVVSINDRNVTTDLFGRAIFTLGYGTYEVFAFLGDRVESVTVLMNQDKSVGIAFHPEPEGVASSNITLAVLCFVGVTACMLYIIRKRK